MNIEGEVLEEQGRVPGTLSITLLLTKNEIMAKIGITGTNGQEIIIPCKSLIEQLQQIEMIEDRLKREIDS